MTSWVRLWADMPTDPKWRVIAKRSGRPIAEVIAVFVFMMTNAGANASERGELENWSDEDVAAALDTELEYVEAIRVAMSGKVLDGEHLTGWDKRQPKREDGSAERAKQWRERKRTQANAEKRPDTDTDTDTDKTPYSPPAGGSVIAFADPFFENQIIERPDGSLELSPTRKQFWLEQFSGDDVRLALALKQAAGERQHGSRQPLLRQIERTLARIAGQKRDSDQRYRSAATANARSAGVKPDNVRGNLVRFGP